MAKEFNMPKGLNGWMVRRFIKDYREINRKDVRAGYGYLGGWVSCIVNFLLAGFKLALGLTVNSKALIADAIHSAGDMITSAIVIFGFKMAKKPRDQEHPFGHANAELIASLVMSVLLIVAGVEILQYNAFKLLEGNFEVVKADWLTIGLVALTILVKEWLFHVSKGLANTIGSTMLDADAWHHRLDSLSTLLVLISLGANLYEIYWMDAAMGVLVGGFVFWTGVELAQDAISPLLGEMVDTETLREIQEVAMEDEHVGNVHDIMVHKYGEHHYISMHMEILDHLSPTEMHDISADVSRKLAKRFNGDCVVHVDPVEFDSDRYREVSAILREIMEDHDEIIDFHDLQFRDEDGSCNIFWEYSIDPSFKEEDYEGLKADIDRLVRPKLENDTNRIFYSLEPGYAILRRG